MSIIDVYERALERHDLEKTAEAYVDTYGTEDGYLPDAYFGAFIELEKEAHSEMMVDTFAPETGYIPAAYVEALEKEAGLIDAGIKGLKGIGTAISKKIKPGGYQSKGGNFGLKQTTGGGGVNVKAFGKDYNISNQALGYGAGALGVGAIGATGAGAGYMLGSRNN